LGIGDWAQSPIPNPQSPIPNPHLKIVLYYFIIYKKLSLMKIIKYNFFHKIKMENKENNENKEESTKNEEKCMTKSNNNVCVNHVSLRDFILFREEFLKYLGEFKKEVATNFSKEQKKYDNFIDQTSSVILAQINSNNFVSKLSFVEEKNELLSYIKKIETNVINQIMINKINLTSCKKDLSDACFKYDKIISENLLISGLIGISCPFSNLKEYLLNNKEEIANNILDIKKNSIEIKEYKNRVESIYEQLKFQINNIRGTLQAYTELKIKEINEKYDNFIALVSDKLSSLNIQNSQLIVELRDKEEKMTKSSNFIEKLKEEVVENNEKSINTITKNNNKVLHQLTQAKNEFKSMKKNIVDLSMLLTKKDNDKNKKNKDKIIKNFNDMMSDLIKETFINEKKNELNYNYNNYNITNNNFANSNIPNKDNNNAIKNEKENESANVTNNSNKLNQNMKSKEIEEENKKSEKKVKDESKIKLKFSKDIEKSNNNNDNKNDEEIDFDRILKKLSSSVGRNPTLIEEKKSEENIKNLNQTEEDNKKSEEDEKTINKEEEDEEEEEKKIVKNLEKVKNIDYQIIPQKSNKKRNKSKNRSDNSSESKYGNESHTKSNKSESKNEVSKSKNEQKKNMKNIDDEKDEEKTNEEKNILKKKNKSNSKLVIMSHPVETNKTISNEKKRDNNNDINNDNHNIYYKTFSNFNSFKFEKNPKRMEKSNTLLNQNKKMNYKNHIKIIKDNNLKIFEKNKYHNSKINNLLTLDNDKRNRSIRKDELPIKKNIFSMYDYLRSSRDQSNYKINKTEKRDLNNSKTKENKNRIKSKDIEEISNKNILKKIAFIRDEQIIDKPLLCNQENFEVSRSAGDMERKLLHLEFFVKKKFDELVKEIKIFIPIHFNSYTRDYNIIFK